MFAALAVSASFAGVARLEPPCVAPTGCASRLEARGLPHAARASVVAWALRGPGPGYRESLAWLVAHEDGAGPSDALEAVAAGTDPQTWPAELRSALAFHRARWHARNGRPDRALRLLHGDDSQRALLLAGTLVGQSTHEADRVEAVRLLARAARDPDGDPDNRDLARVNAGRVLWTLGRPELAWALFAEVDPDGAHGAAAARGALWCEVALGYTDDLVQQRLDQLDVGAERLVLSAVLALQADSVADAEAARAGLAELVDAEAEAVDTLAGLRGTLAWAAWAELRDRSPEALQSHVDGAGDAALDEVVAEFARVGHRPEVGPALRAELAHGIDRRGTHIAGAAAERRAWRDAEAHLSALLSAAEAADPAPATFPLAGGRWGWPRTRPTPRTPARCPGPTPPTDPSPTRVCSTIRPPSPTTLACPPRAGRTPGAPGTTSCA